MHLNKLLYRNPIRNPFGGTTSVLCLCLLTSSIYHASAQDAFHALHLAATVMLDQRPVDFGNAQQLVFQSKNGNKQSVPTSGIVRWNAWRPPLNNSAVWLSDGSWLVGRIEAVGADALTLHGDLFHPLEIPLSLCRGVVNSSPATTSQWHQLERQMLAASGDRDFIWLDSGQQQTGILKWPASAAQETNLESGEPRISLESKGQTRDFGSHEIQAIVFCPSLHPPLVSSQPRLFVGLRDGTLLGVREFQRTADGRLRIKLGLPMDLVSLDHLRKVAIEIDYLANSPAGVIWLGDLEPIRYRHASQSSIAWGLGRNVDLFQRPLTFRERMVSRGLAMHSAAQATYRWDGKPGKFLCEIAMAAPLDGSDEALGSVQCQVLLAREGKIQTAYSSPILRSRTPPLQVDVDITGAQLVVLLTDMADVGQIGDHVLWFDARFARAE